MGKVDWRGFIAVAIALVVLGNYLADRNGPTSRVTPVLDEPAGGQTGAPSTAPLQVLASAQSSDGATDADLSPALADKIGLHGASRMQTHIDSRAAQPGVKQPAARVTSSATVIDVSGKKLIVIRYDFNGPSKAVEILSIKGSELHRVMCMRDSLEPIALTNGPCADKILAVHGVALATAGT